MNALKHHSELTAINIVNAITVAFLLVSPWLCCMDRLVGWLALRGGVA